MVPKQLNAMATDLHGVVIERTVTWIDERTSNRMVGDIGIIGFANNPALFVIDGCCIA